MAQTNVTDLLGSIAEQCRECPVPTMVRTYIDVARDFCQRTRWLRKTVTGISTVVDQVPYTITADTDNDFVGIFSLDLLESSTETRQLVEQVASFWDPDASSDIPERFEYVPTGTFKLDPPPSAVYSLVVVAFMRPKKASQSIDAGLADECYQALEHGVLATLKAIKGMPWSDPVGAANEAYTYECEVGSYSIMSDSGNNAGGRTGICGGPPNARIRSRILKL